MNKFELFCMVFYVLDADWDDTKDAVVGECVIQTISCDKTNNRVGIFVFTKIPTFFELYSMV